MSRVPVRTNICENGLRRDSSNQISHWKFVGYEPKGTREKFILKRDYRTYLFKKPKDTAEIFTEVFNSILAAELDLNHVQYFPATYSGKPGVVCESFLRYSPQIDEFMEMKELLFRHSVKLQSISPLDFKKMHGRTAEAVAEQDIDNIYMVLDHESGGAQNVLKPFFRMVGFDALIGHTDRHWENYGLLLAYNRKRSIVVRPAPIYDTVTSFLVGTEEHKLEGAYNTQLRRPEWYTPKRNDNSKIKAQKDLTTNHFDLLRYIANSKVMSVYKDDLFWAFDRFKPKVAKEIMARFFPELSEIRAKCVMEILCQRHRIGNELRNEVK